MKDVNRTAELILDEMLHLIGVDFHQHQARQFEMLWGLPPEVQIDFATMALRRHFQIVQHRFPKWKPPGAWLEHPAKWCSAHGFRNPRLPRPKFSSDAAFVDSVHAMRCGLKNLENQEARTHALCYVVERLATARSLYIMECDEPEYSLATALLSDEARKYHNSTAKFEEELGCDDKEPEIVTDGREWMKQHFLHRECVLVGALRAKNRRFEPSPPVWQLHRAVSNVAQSSVLIREWHVAYNWLSQPDIRAQFVWNHGADFQAMAKWREVVVWYEIPSIKESELDARQDDPQ